MHHKGDLIKDLEILYSVKPPSVGEAFRIQSELSQRVVRTTSPKPINTIAGADIAICVKEKKLVCGIILFSYPELEEIERVWTVSDEVFPYIPGLLGFREAPGVIRTFGKLRERCDMIMIDGHGLAHPRGFGLACHVGVLLDIPAIGVAKKCLYGTFVEPGLKKGEKALIRGKNREIVGAALRTRDRVKPVFVSVGNRTDLDTAVKIALECSRGLRIPEPTRLADKYVGLLKKQACG
ncbi:MAG: endonuclease V [Candidatus Dadabacteria bacterium]|nr:endonuclease V [Candidatus Dadabacteria bacterium]MYA49028.1 endonuclease V [Candidatus Dadabacteria bacterium]MYF47641.1 endonuclease V [Candidatus Dadabacteria bacterium]MYG82376.1 endonuclease V [Candidatus Dadabacteria bacterium]MYK49473.1 endonuclease V [Candidatus Dadabacteria bacterium]